MKDVDMRTVKIPAHLVESLKVIAATHHRALQGEVAHALEQYVAEHQHIVDAASAA